MSEVLDYSSGWPRTIAPYIGTVRYVGTPGHSKNLTAAEADARAAAGIPQAFVYEAGAGWMLGGRNAGINAAGAAHHDLTALGQPYRVVYFAADFDTAPAQLEIIDACLAGAATIIGRDSVGVYGEADVIDHCLAAGTAAYGWQTRAWSGGRVSPRACLLQQVGYVTVDGVQCDRNTIMRDDWGQWPVEGDVSYDDAAKAIRDVLHLPAAGLTPARGQVDNGNLAAILVGMAQSEVNRDAAEAAAVRALTSAVNTVQAAIGHLSGTSASEDPVADAKALLAELAAELTAAQAAPKATP